MKNNKPFDIELIIPDTHADPRHDNNRADWLGRLIADLRPNSVKMMGDGADMASLCSYDKNTRDFKGRSYSKDIEAHVDFQERLWAPLKKKKKKLPKKVYLVGNHENRIERALDLSPELEGTISMKDLELERFYDDVIYYNGGTPGVYEDNGILYSHYIVSGVMGRPVGGVHAGHSLLTKKLMSCTVGHSHELHFSTLTKGNGDRINGLSSGCYFDGYHDWAGEANKLYWRGVIIKRNVENGSYDPEFISIDRLKREYGED